VQFSVKDFGYDVQQNATERPDVAEILSRLGKCEALWDKKTKQLMEMGFPRTISQGALLSCADNLQRAAILLLEES